ncbi:MAG: hypothetical protein WD766_09800 [Gemmatimonadota bacterium]
MAEDDPLEPAWGMLRATPALMRTSFLLTLVLLNGCGGGESIIEGTLLDGDDARWVWVEGAADRVPISSAEFRVEGVRGDTIDLRFADDDGDAGRMRILGLPDGSRLRLRQVWFEDERAFPTTIELGSGRAVEINRVRMASSDAQQGDLRTRGTLLASSADSDALLVRVVQGEGADLRVVINPATVVTGPDGAPASAERLEFGDSLTIAGSFAGGYLIASEITVPRSVAMGIEAGDGSDDNDDRARGARDSDRDRARDDDDDYDEPGRRRRFGRSVGGRGRS